MSNRVLGYGLLVIGAFLAWGSLAWLWHRVQVLETENGGLKTVLTAKMETRKADNGQEMARISIAEVGEETLRRALIQLQKLNARRLTLAVDSRNSMAIRIYQRYGFHRLRQLEAWFLAIKP